jgi:hypothetical protein
MDTIKTAPRKVYYFIAALIEMILLFFYSILYMGKPSDTLTREDIDGIRHKRRPDPNGNDYSYRGKRS